MPVYGGVQSFTTSSPQSGIPSTGWLELPQVTGNEDYAGIFYGSGPLANGDNRNYSYIYSNEYFASLWTAYPLTLTHKTGNASTSTWRFNPNISQNYQIDMTLSLIHI